jgi:hypothetical protein
LVGNSRYKGRRRDAPRRYNPRESERATMLNLHKIIPFRFDIREIMTHYKIDEAVASSVVASVIAKASRISIKAAQEYVVDQEAAGSFQKEVTGEICELLDRYSKYR